MQSTKECLSHKRLHSHSIQDLARPYWDPATLYLECKQYYGILYILIIRGEKKGHSKLG